MRRALPRLCRSVAGAAASTWVVAWGLLGAGCDRSEMDLGIAPDALRPTAMAWLEPVGASDAEGRLTLVGRPDGVEVKGRVEGLRASAMHRLSIYDRPRCPSLARGRPVDVLARAESDRAGAIDHFEIHAGLGPVDGTEGGVAGRTVVVDVIEGGEGGGTPVACGRIRFIGDLSDASDGRWQGVVR